MKMIIFVVAILSSVALIPTSVYATINSIPGVGPSGEDTFPPGTKWTYNLIGVLYTLNQTDQPYNG